jgi:hypothetical protein
MQIADKRAAWLTAALLMTSGTAQADDSASALRDAEADARFKAMSDYLAGLEAFSADAMISDEQIMTDGFKLDAMLSANVKVRRPDGLRVQRKGMVRDQEVIFDGERAVVFGKRLGRFMALDAKGDLDAGLDAITEALGAELPGRDLLSADPYTPLIEPVTESAYLGTVEIHGRTCRHLAFRTDEVDWQLWVQEGDQPLPCRYAITSKWTYGAPQYTVTFSNWQINPTLADSEFEFSPPEGVQEIDVQGFVEMMQSAGDE